MKGFVKRLLFWAPRILCILVAVSLGVFFAIEMLGEGQRGGYGFWKTILYLLAVQLPSVFILGLLAISWRREWVGALLFFALAVLMVWLQRSTFQMSDLLAAAPLVLVGLLFLLNWIYRAELRTR